MRKYLLCPFTSLIPLSLSVVPLCPSSLQTEGEGSSAELVLCTTGERTRLQRASSIETDKNSDVVKALGRVPTIPSLLGGSREDTCEYRDLNMTVQHFALSLSLSLCLSPSPPSLSPPHSIIAGATSTGLSMKILQKCAAFSTGSALVLLSAPPSPPSGRGGLFGVGSSVSKGLFYNICFSIQTGKSLGHVELLPTPQLHCALTKGASMMAMGKSNGVQCRLQCPFIPPTPPPTPSPPPHPSLNCSPLQLSRSSQVLSLVLAVRYVS